MPSATHGRKKPFYLIAAAIATVIIWQIPFGGVFLYPFTILSTWFHEMGHGLTAMLLGGDFQQLQVFANGSGLASYAIPNNLGRLGRALIAAGGPLGPAIAGSLLIFSARWPQSSRTVLIVLAAVMVLSLLWMRTIFGWLAIAVWVAAIGAIIWRGPQWLQEGMVPFLGVQACISTFRQVSYLLTGSAVINGRQIPSDTGQIAQQLGLTHWFWGLLLGGLSLGLLAFSLMKTFDIRLGNSHAS